jgi:hypothetical protein
MRILSLAFVTIFLCAGPAAAQGWTWAVKGGVNFSTLTFEAADEDRTLDWRVGAVVGGFVRFPLLSWLDLQPEVLYTRKGANEDTFGISSAVLLDYLEVPVLARIPFAGRKYFIVAGPYFGVRLRARTRTEFSGSTEELDISDSVERLDYGLSAGGGVEIGSIVIDGRYSFSLGDVDSVIDAIKGRNRVVTATAGFRF